MLVALIAGCEVFETHPDHGYLEPARIVERYLASEGAVKTLEGEARVEIDSPEREGSLRATILIAKPHRFRMVAYPPVGGTVFDISIVHDLACFHLPREQKIIERKLSAPMKKSNSFGGLNSIFAETGLAALILGHTANDRRPDLKMLDRSEKLVTFGVFDENGFKEGEIEFLEGSFFKVRHRTFGKGGRTVLDVTYGKYSKVEDSGLWWPHTIRISCPEKKFTLTMDFHDLELNGDIPADAFKIEVPPGTKTIRD
jgi:hypothetical protein